MYGKPAITLALAQYTTVESLYTKQPDSSTVELRFTINDKELNLYMSKQEFEFSMKPLLTTDLTVAQMAPSIRDQFGDDLANIAIAFAITLKSFSKYKAYFSVQSFVDEITQFRGEVTVQADVPQEAGLGSSASYFSALMLNLYVDLRDWRQA